MSETSTIIIVVGIWIISYTLIVYIIEKILKKAKATKKISVSSTDNRVQFMEFILNDPKQKHLIQISQIESISLIDGKTEMRLIGGVKFVLHNDPDFYSSMLKSRAINVWFVINPNF